MGGRRERNVWTEGMEGSGMRTEAAVWVDSGGVWM